MVATSEARVSSTLTLTRSRNVAPASSSTRLMLVTTLANCASKLSGSARFSSKPGMPEMNSRSPTRAANESGGALTPAGGGKCLMGMGEPFVLAVRATAPLPVPRLPSYTSGMNRDELIAAYTAPGRHYHNLRHIEDCLGALAAVNDLSAAEREILTETIWWHDVVYDPTRADNEELSARLAEAHVQSRSSSGSRPPDPPDKNTPGRIL